MEKTIRGLIAFLISSTSFGQDKKELKLTFSGFLETYYAYDFNQPITDAKLPFMYNYNRHNEFNINIGLLRAKVEYENAYATVSLHSGTYVDDNYAYEKIQYLNEAYIGLYLDQSKKQSLEVGILPSYIGFESAVTASNLTLTRSIFAENSPYFMTGLKYTYKPNSKLSFSGLVTNGWQRINKLDKKVLPALGSQIIYKPSDKSVFNWSTFIGKELYNNEWGMRYFSNLYWDKQWNPKWHTVFGFDSGMQNTNEKQLFWMSPVLVAQYTLVPKWQTALRAEYYQDQDNVIIAVNDEFKTLSLSMNIDYLLNDKVKFRTEARYLNSQKKVFVNESSLVNDNFFLTTSLSFEF
ncbi:outer membrane beta-barrel protein [Flavobacterium sp. 25HG05S-40]|uniref:outer membrane beta-barrel protein n=1 Tax=Flavobacterium sp. 25HG05S-40 TaxID=3458682 RepID=UPI004043A495